MLLQWDVLIDSRWLTRRVTRSVETQPQSSLWSLDKSRRTIQLATTVKNYRNPRKFLSDNQSDV